MKDRNKKILWSNIVVMVTKNNFFKKNTIKQQRNIWLLEALKQVTQQCVAFSFGTKCKF